MPNTKDTEPLNTKKLLENWGRLHSTVEASAASENFWISKNKKEQGNKGEALAQELLMAKGFTIIRANWRTPHGEVDLVASFEETVFIFEIKTRAQWQEGRRHLISWSQRQRLHRAAVWIWQNLRRDYKFFKCKALLVTQHGIEIRNLPLLYDRN